MADPKLGLSRQWSTAVTRRGDPVRCNNGVNSGHFQYKKPAEALPANLT